MNRKEFLHKSAYGALGAVALSQWLWACRKTELFEEGDYSGKVVVIGAGAAGLYAAYLLRSKGVEVEVLEAADRYGGRLGKLEGFADYPLDLGAQWLHGKNSILGDLIKRTDTAISRDNSESRFWFEGELKRSTPVDIADAFSKEALPDVSFLDYADQQGWGRGSAYEYIVEWAAGDQGAGAEAISAFWNIKEEENWSSGEADFKFEQTFFDLFNNHVVPTIADRIRTNTVVNRIDYSGSSIVVTDQQGQTYTADKVIVSVPLPILQDGDIQFTPALPSAKVAAFQKLGMGPGMKVFLKFSEAFYPGNIVGGAVCAAYADEREGKSGSDHVLLAFVMGTQAQKLTDLGSDQAIINALLAELDDMFDGAATAAYLDGRVQNWTTEPFVRGAYSYATVGVGESRKTAAEPIEDRLLFAGEAMNLNGHHQTVHGAVETAIREVTRIFESAQ
ncbi:MAG: flavin monoamine oxidase family protein [Salibacteraceae bacterium]